MAYALKLPEQFIPLTGLIDPQALIQGGSNTISYEKESGIHQHIFELFSTHHSPQSQPAALSQLIEAGNQPEIWQNLGYHNIFRIVIMEFIDAYSFDLRSIRKSCVHIAHPDGKRMIPFDTYNLFYRDELEQTVLNPIREKRQPMGGAISVKMVDPQAIRTVDVS